MGCPWCPSSPSAPGSLSSLGSPLIHSQRLNPASCSEGSTRRKGVSYSMPRIPLRVKLARVAFSLILCHCAILVLGDIFCLSLQGNGRLELTGLAFGLIHDLEREESAPEVRACEAGSDEPQPSGESLPIPPDARWPPSGPQMMSL